LFLLFKVKVIDMTGKEQRILSGYHAIGAQKMLPDDDVDADAAKSRNVVNFDLPELRHNIDMLLDRFEEDLIAADRKLKHNTNQVEVLQV
jgi:tuftelin-interacting protein 11